MRPARCYGWLHLMACRTAHYRVASIDLLVETAAPGLARLEHGDALGPSLAACAQTEALRRVVPESDDQGGSELQGGEA